MYLEISNRQTGKTSRLISQIYADKNIYEHQILIGINYNAILPIKKQIKSNNKLHLCVSIKALQTQLNSIDIHSCRLYVDEFLFSNLFCNHFDFLFQNYKHLLKTGYFSSSLNTQNYIILNSLANLSDTGTIQVIKYPKGFSNFV